MFETVIEKVMFSPGVNEAGPLFVMTRSATMLLEETAVEELPLGVGSVVGEETAAVFVIEPLKFTGTA